MSKCFTAACVQITSGADPAANLEAASALVREARSAGASLIATPEVSNVMGLRRREVAALARPEAEDTSVAGYRALAAETGAWLLAGSPRFPPRELLESVRQVLRTGKDSPRPAAGP